MLICWSFLTVLCMDLLGFYFDWISWLYTVRESCWSDGCILIFTCYIIFIFHLYFHFRAPRWLVFPDSLSSATSEVNKMFCVNGVCKLFMLILFHGIFWIYCRHVRIPWLFYFHLYFYFYFARPTYGTMSFLSWRVPTKLCVKVFPWLFGY